MIISTPTKDQGNIDKTVEVGGGIMVPVEGTRYHTTCEVLEIDESGQRVRAKSIGFEGWFAKAAIKDALSPGAYAIESAINREE